MRFYRELGVFSVLALMAVSSRIAFAYDISADIPTKAYVDNTRVAVAQGSGNAGKALVVGNDGNVAPATIATGENNVIESITMASGALTPTNKTVNIPVMTGATASSDGKPGVVPAPTIAEYNDHAVLGANGRWVLAVQSVGTGITDGTISVNGGDVAVRGFSGKQTKPSSGVASGKVLTYTGTDANANVSAAYIKVPVSSGAPSSNTPSSFAEIWIE